MTAGAGRGVSYTAFNMTLSVTQGDNEEEYIYDPEHARVELYDYQGESANVLYYLNDPSTGAMSEMSWVGYTWHDYLKVDGKLIAERFCTVGTTCSSTTAWRYFVTDSLGSVATVTDSTASPDAAHTERDAYDPWGKKRSPITGADDNSCYSASISDRGYTGHEHINGVCLINENARAYDPLLGRFMAPDDVIADIYDGQGLNRYTYVDNRPMTLTDPTGHVMVWDDAAEVGAVIACAGPQALICAGVAIVVIGGGILCYEYCGQLFEPSNKNGSPPSQPAGATPSLPPSVAPDVSRVKPIEARGPTPLEPVAKPGPNPNQPAAEGAHSTVRRDPKTGNVTRTDTWVPNSRNPSGWDHLQNIDKAGRAHNDKRTDTPVPTPHVQGREFDPSRADRPASEHPEIPGGVRPAKPEEIPRSVF